MWPLLLLPLLLLPAFAGTADALDPAELSGRRIVSVRIVGPEPPLDPTIVEDLVRTRVGESLRPLDVADTIRGLAAAGNWDLLEARAEPEGEGVALVFELRPRPRIAEIVFRGARRKTALASRSHLGLTAGSVYRADLAQAGARRLRETLGELGWTRPVVSISTEPVAGRDVRVVVDAESGPRIRVAAIEVRGAPPEAPAAQLLEASGLESGDVLHLAAREKAIGKSRRELIRRGFFEAAVSIEASEPRPDGSADAVIVVSAGSRWEISRSGVEESVFSREEIDDLVFAEAADDFLWNRLASKIRAEFQGDGFPEPSVRVRVDPSQKGRPRLLLEAEPGEKRRISTIVFEGRRVVPEKELLAVMETTPRGLFGGGRLIDETMRRDVDSLRALYSSLGHLEAKVGSVRLEPDTPKRFRLVIPIEEGPVCRVESVAIEGIPPAEAAEILPTLALRAGQPFDPARVVDDLFLLRGRWADRGYLDVRAEEIPPAFSPDRSSVRLAWRVTPGSQTLVDRVLIRGNTFTRPGVVRRLVKLAPGDPLSIKGLVDSQQALARSGLFTRAEVGVTGPEGRSRRDVMATIEEGKPISLVYGAGLEYDPNRDNREVDPRGSFSIYHNNLFGTARVAGFEARVSTIGYHYLAAYREPRPFGLDLPASLQLFRSKDERSSISTTITRRGSFLDTTIRLSEHTRAQPRYEYQIVQNDCDNTQVDCESVVGSLERQEQENAISALSMVLLTDRRDDPFDPHSGAMFGIEGKWAFPAFDADAEFWKLFGHTSAYYTLGKVTLAGSLRAGVMAPLREVTNAAGLPALEIPIVERFFAGGRTTHRAFELDGLGIKGQTLTVEADGDVTPLGGDALALASLELRFPIYGRLVGTVFWDAGNVWSEPSKVDAGDIRHGVGVGIRFKTPVGPIRVDYGWKLDRQPGESVYEYSLSIGYPY